MRSLDLSGDAKRQRVAAADRTEAKEVKIAAGEVGSGKTAKISFILLRCAPPIVVDAIEVHHFRLQALRFQHGGKAEDADRGKLAHDASCVLFAQHLAMKLVGRGRTDEADFHGCHLLAEPDGVEAMRPIRRAAGGRPGARFSEAKSYDTKNT